ncbi:MAG: hypothetical protein IKR23_05700 [Lachnospiraceae bacterium]|nr:hypothetical protein [Lachnospiraceae bacterium]
MPATVRLQNKVEKPKRLSRAQKREAQKRNEELLMYGAALQDIKSEPGPGRFFLCFVRAALIFLASFGMLGGLVRAFGLSFSIPVVVIAYMFLAFITAFLYYNKLTFYLGYFVIFGAFIFFSLFFYWEVNSGYMAFLSEVFKKYSDFFHVATSDVTEIIQDRYLTVTMAMIFMGWFFSILLNITISGYMDLFTTFLITFLPLQIAFYVNIVPPLPYMMMLFASYIAVAVLGHSGRFTLPYKSGSRDDFSRQRSRKKTSHIYYSTSKGMLQISAWSIGLSVIFLLVCGGLFSADISTQNSSNKVKDATDNMIKKYLDGGFASLFDRYDATGGLSHGRLGGISNVSPDFETDLLVRFLPNSSESMYLKAYTGVTYSSSTFYPFYDAGDNERISGDELTELDSYYPQLSAMHDTDFSQMEDKDTYISKMWISNIDAGDEYDYRPYYTIASTTGNSGESGGIADRILSQTPERYPVEYKMLDDEDTIESYAADDALSNYETLYMPYSELATYTPNPEITKEYQDKVYEYYLQVPEDIEDTLEEFCQEAQLYDAAGYYDSLADGEDHPVYPADAAEYERYLELQKQRLGIAARLKRYFASNFQYTMAPGATPRSKDVVSYFLTVQKRGYCAHFASSSTMLLRHMGIPTRYVEGYMMTFTDMLEGSGVTTDVEGWQYPATTILPDSGIIEVPVTDASAHAWIEIYLDGYGWIPYDTTPPSDENDVPVNFNFLGLFSGLFTTTNRTAATGNDPAALQLPQNSGSFAFLGSLSFLLRPLGILLASLILFILSFPMIRFIREEYNISRHCSRGEFSRALLIYYRRFIKKLISSRTMALTHPTIRDSYELLINTGVDGTPLETDDAAALRSAVEQAAFSNNELDRSEYDRSRDLLKKLTGRIRKQKKRK